MPEHTFLLLPDLDTGYADYMRFLNDPRAIEIKDDLLDCVWDTLTWIPSVNPSNPTRWEGHGLNRFGPTVINREGAAKAAAVFGSWAALLAEGPETLELRGCWIRVGGEPETEGHYERLRFSRDSVVGAFRAIAEYAEKAKTGKFYLLHLGV
jgi:hypothetical protein